MSLQRAYVNCMRCYELAQPYIKASKILDKGCILRNNNIYQARNDTLGALEDALASDDEEITPIIREGIRAIRNSCALCDYQKAYVAYWAKRQFMPEEE